MLGTRSLALIALLGSLLVGSLALGAGPVSAVPEVDDYAPYQPQQWCNPEAKPGTRVFARWLVRQHGGGFGPISRRCRIGGVSEHKEGRAFDWMLDARTKRDRRRARAFLDRLFATDAAGNQDALARRMGVMYVIWNDRIWSSYSGFEPRDYLSSSCPSLQQCSATLRHRNHMHISLSRPGGKGRTSWYAGRL